MHKNLRDTNKIHPIVLRVLRNFPDFFAGKTEEKTEENLPVLERENVQKLIEKRVKMIGAFVPFRENKIRKRLLVFIKKNRRALINEQTCCRLIKQFTPAAFLFCEVCEHEHETLNWDACKMCGTFNNYII